MNVDLISLAKHMREPTPSDESTITQNTADLYRLPWLSGDICQAPEHYTPRLCTGRVCSVVELLWNLAVYNGMECRGPSVIAYNKGMINIDTDDLYRAQSTDRALMTIKSWINEVDDKNINMQEMAELHSEVKQLYTVRKQIKLMESTDQVKVRLLCLIEGKCTD